MLELLTQADMVLNACGRPIPPAGYRWVDLPRIIPYQRVLAAGVGQTVSRVQNIANTVFLCRGVAINTASAAYQIRWPNGRVLEAALARNPVGTSQIMKALLPEVPLDPQGQISITLNSLIGASAVDDTTTVLFYGVLRYLLRARGDEPPFPVMSISQAPRVRSGPNQNIMCPEWLLGEQCTPETPPGYWDEPFTLFADPITVSVTAGVAGSPVLDFAVQLPGDCDWFVIKRWGFSTTLDAGVLTGQPVVGWRLADGYSVTGGDMVPTIQDSGTAPSPTGGTQLLPSLPVPGGTRMLLDVDSIDATGTGDLVTIVRFDGVKRRKLAA